MVTISLFDGLVDGITNLLSADVWVIAEVHHLVHLSISITSRLLLVVLLHHVGLLLLLLLLLLHSHLLRHHHGILTAHVRSVELLGVLTITAHSLVAIVLVHAAIVILVVATVVMLTPVLVVSVSSLAILVVVLVVSHTALVATLVVSSLSVVLHGASFTAISHVARIKALEEVLLDLLETFILPLLMEFGTWHPVLDIESSGSKRSGVVEFLDSFLGMLDIFEKNEVVAVRRVRVEILSLLHFDRNNWSALAEVFNNLFLTQLSRHIAHKEV